MDRQQPPRAKFWTDAAYRNVKIQPRLRAPRVMGVANRRGVKENPMHVTLEVDT